MSTTTTTARSHPKADPVWQRLGPTLEQRREIARAAVQAQRANGSRPRRLQKILRKRLTSKCSSWRIRKQLRRRLSPTRTPTVQPSRRSEEAEDSWTGRRLQVSKQQLEISKELEAGDPTGSSSTTRHREQDEMILECERLRQAAERCGKAGSRVKRATGSTGGCRLEDAIDECSEAARLAEQEYSGSGQRWCT